MARPLRLEFRGAVYHVTARGNARQAIFLDELDRIRFLDRLAREIGQQRWVCHAYCLMDNHYHLLLETPEGFLVRGMQRLNGSYTQWFNRRHGRVGHLFQGRYKSILVEKESYLLQLCRYVVLNPVRAGVVSRPEGWRWSSYRDTAGFRTGPGWLQTEWVLAHFGALGKPAQLAYRRFVLEGLDAASPWESLRGQIWLGRETFLERMQRMVERQALEGVPNAQARPAQPTADGVVGAVADAYGLPPDAVLSRRDERAFRVVLYLLRRAALLRLNEVAALAGLSAPRVSQLQKAVEESEPDPELTRLLERFHLRR